MPDKQETTGENTHRATRRGYADGFLIEAGEAVPAGVPVGSWMEKGKGRPIGQIDRKNRGSQPINPYGAEQ